MSWKFVIGLYLGGLVVVLLVRAVAIWENENKNISELFAWDSRIVVVLSILFYPILVAIAFVFIIIDCVRLRRLPFKSYREEDGDEI